MSSQFGYDPTKVAGSGETIYGTAGAAIANRDICCVAADGLYYPADADLAVWMPAFGIAMSTMAAGQTGQFLVKGFIGLATWTWTPGSELYVSATAGQMSHTAGAIRQQVGVAFTATQVFIHPQGLDSETGCALLAGSTAYVGFDNCKAAAYSNYWVCDGAADEVQINLAVAYVIAQGGGSVELEEGAYSLEDEVDITASNITFRGQGFNTQLTQTALDGSETIRVYGLVGAHIDHVIIENLRLIGNAASGDGIWMRYCDHGIIRDCWFSAHGNHGIYSNYNWYANIENNYCYDNGVHGINAAGGNYNVIQGNTCNSNANSGIQLDETSTVVDNTCWNNAAWDGITVLDDGEQSVVSNNECLQNARHGIMLSSVIEVHVSDNVCFDNDTYGIAEAGTSELNMILDNNCLENDTGGLLLIGTGTRAFGNKVDGTNAITDGVIIPTLVLSFVQGTTFLSTFPIGWEIDLATEYAAALGHLPLDVQQVFRWKIWATSLVTEADAMRLEIQGRGGASNEPFTTEAVNVADHPSTTTNFTANDVIYWVVDATDDIDLDDMVAGDQIMIKVLHEAAGGGDAATDAVFTCVEIEYV